MAAFLRGSIEQFFKGDPNLVGYWSLQQDLIDYAKNQNLAITGNVQIGVRGFRTHNRATRILDTSSYLSSSVSFLPSGNSARTVLIWLKKIGSLAANTNHGICGYGANSTAQDFSLALSADANLNVRLYLRRYYDDQRTLNTFPSNFFEIKERLIGVHYPGTVTGDLFFTVDGNLYLRDSAFGSGSVTFNTPSTSTFYIGRWVIGNNIGDCLVSEIAVFSRLISLKEISSYYKWATGQKKLFFVHQPFLNLQTSFSMTDSFTSKIKTTGSMITQFSTNTVVRRGIPRQLIKDIKTEEINFDIINQP